MADLKEMYERSQQDSQNKEKMGFTNGETENFKKAFDDPEFRKMFTEYMDEMQDPNNRQETEDYIKQLEGEQKVPQGKELVRPKASFVAKTCKMVKGVKGDKVFINIVSSEAIKIPSKETRVEGISWSLPYSLGPPHMEKDKNESNVACFDCCFHPDALKQVEINKKFRDSLVMTAIEGVEEAYRRQKQVRPELLLLMG
jgi:dynein assembly factor 2